LLEALAQRLREEDDLADPRWEALPSGSLSAEDEAELAARGPRAAYEAHQPIGGGEREAIADAAFAEIARRKTAKTKDISIATPTSSEVAAKEASKPAAVISLAGRRRALYGFAATAVLAAASFALLYRPASAPIAGYVAFVDEGNREQRAYVEPGNAPSAAPIVLQGDARVHVTLRPETAVQGAIAARSFLVAGGEVRAWQVPVELGPNGTLRVAGMSRATFSAAADGAYDLVFVVGRAEALPSDAALRARIAGHERVAASAGIQIVSLKLRLGPP
jgi:hypothetical protein